MNVSKKARLFGVLVLLVAVGGAPARADSSFVPFEQGQVGGGLPVIYVSAPESPWAVVQLHIRALGSGLEPDEAAGVGAFARALTEGKIRGSAAPSARAKVAEVGGVTRMWRSADSVVISDAVPAEVLDVALAAMNARLAGRARLESSPTFAPPLDVDSRIPGAARQLLAPGHPYALALDSVATVDDPLRDRIAGRLLRRDGAVLVVFAPLAPPKLKGAVARRLVTPLPKGALPLDDVAPPQGVRLVEGAPANGMRSREVPPTALWFPGPAPLRFAARAPTLPEGVERDRIREQAALRLVARVLDLDLERRVGATWLGAAVEVAGTDAERRRLDELAALAERALDDGALAQAIALERAAAARRTAEPELLCFDLGRTALVFGDGRMLEWELAALEEIDGERLREAALAVLRGPRVVVRQGALTLEGAP